VRTGGLLVEDEVNARKGTYTTYSIGVGIVWAVILVMVSLASSADKRHTFFVGLRRVRHRMGFRDDSSLRLSAPEEVPAG
jgi:hypothetical protein